MIRLGDMRFFLEFVFIGLVFVLYSEGRCTGNYRISFTCYKPQQQRIIHYRACGWFWRNRCQRHVTYIIKFMKSTCYKLQSYPNECGKEVKRLACQISQLRKTGRITLASGHQSQVQDNAFAINNIEDSYNGRKAKRSSYTCSECRVKPAPGGSVCLNPVVLKYVLDLASRGKVTVNELAGACHSCRSLHYDGKAVDLKKINRDQDFKDTCKKFGGWYLSEKTHIHCQFRI